MDGEIDIQVREFLAKSLFGRSLRRPGGGAADRYETASGRAYRDLCRTLRVSGVPGAGEARDRCAGAVAGRLRALLAVEGLGQDAYNEEHRAICEELCGIYRETAPGSGFAVGHAQKWVNMAAKYLVVLGDGPALEKLPLMHVPVDSVVMRAAARDGRDGGLGVRCPFPKWTAIDDYVEYLDYQREIRRSLGGTAPLLWEFRAWNDEG